MGKALALVLAVRIVMMKNEMNKLGNPQMPTVFMLENHKTLKHMYNTYEQDIE
jgi:hypothetical protein